MNPLIKKEIRLLLPMWIAAMLLAIAPVWIFGSLDLHFFGSLGGNYYTNFTWIPGSCFAFGVILLGSASFGQEFSLGTFDVLLSQPVERRRLWFVKILVLTFVFILVLLALLVSWQIHFNLYDIAYYQRQPLAHVAPIMSWSNWGSSALYATACFSGGLWTTLLLRRMSEAFWVNVLVPPAIIVIVGAVLGEFIASSKIINLATMTVLALYSVAGFAWARWLFLRAQDLQWTGGIIALSSRKRTAEQTASRPRHWLTALVWKELQLHQANLLIAGVVLLLHLASVVIRKVHPHFADPNVQGLLELIWMLWLLIPLLIGSAAVAEEHRVGVIESQLCLPVSRRFQFILKFSVALILSLVLGGLMPFAIERAINLDQWIFVIAAVIFFISFYASTVARTTIQAIGLTIVVAAAIYFCAVVTAVSVFKFGGAWPYARVGLGLLTLYLGVPIFLLTLAGLMYWNFKWLHPDGKLRWRNGITLFGSFAAIFVLTYAVYFRVWEFLTPVEPPHGPIRLKALTPPKLLAGEDAISVLLADGRLWTEQTRLNRFGRILPLLNTRQFIGGSNWVRAATDPFRIAGIQSDGSLWSVQTYSVRPEYPLTRIGSDTNWVQVSGGYGFLLLKKDGTLWAWGADDNSLSPENLERYLTMPPMRVGNETNWMEVFGRWARKSDGSVWVLGFTRRGTDFVPQLGQVPGGSGEKPFISQALNGWLTAEVNTNNELWFIATPPVENYESIKPDKFQIAKNAKWKAVAFASDNSMIALRSDGTLWQWPAFFWVRKSPRFDLSLYPSRPDLIKPIQLGNYSDWIALRSIWPSLSIALAADGSLWVWKDPSKYEWLAPSRKPVYLGNIFSAQ